MRFYPLSIYVPYVTTRSVYVETGVFRLIRSILISHYPDNYRHCFVNTLILFRSTSSKKRSNVHEKSISFSVLRTLRL